MCIRDSAKAAAKVSMRLVPNQDPDDILKRYTAFVKKLTPKGIETKIKVHSNCLLYTSRCV